MSVVLNLLQELIAYHGTAHDFGEFDPAKTKDIGIHFGTKDQAHAVIRKMWRKSDDPEYEPGARIIKADIDLKNPLRVRDNFSTLKTAFQRRARDLHLLTPGFSLNDEERSTLYHHAKQADLARKRGGGDWSIQLDKNKAEHLAKYDHHSKEFWNTFQSSAKRQGYDGLIYRNRVEGAPGRKAKRDEDSYVVFDKSQIKAGF
jgi:hypothetical protein